jgi:alpha-L-rhamnosidase
MSRALTRRAHRRPALLVASGLTALATVLPTAVNADAGPPARIAPAGLRTQHLAQALGIDDTTPYLSWNVTSRAAGVVQSAYRVQAAGSLSRLRQGKPDLWDSGKVRSGVPQTTYAGRELGSRTRVYWRVMLWSADTGRTSGWSEPAAFETGLTKQRDWDADWITHPDWQLSKRTVEPVVVDLPRTTARYVRLDVTRLGLPLADDFPAESWRLQLGEIDVRDSGSATTGPRAPP